MSAEPVIQFEDVTKVYTTRRGSVAALDGISLTVTAGQFVAIWGPSGCGKSTLLSLIGGLSLPTSGRITVAGLEVSAASSGERAGFRVRNIGYVFQMFHLLPFLNVVDNVLVAAPTAQDPKAAQFADGMLEKLGLQDRRHHRPAQLSTGERQRVAMARALLNQPRILLADEPTGNLDPQNAAIVLDQLSEFHANGGTVVLVTHEQDAASRAQNTICLEQGRIAESVV